MNSFTFNINSHDNTLGFNSAHDVKINPDGFPTQYKSFKCKVLNFMINSLTLLELLRESYLIYLVSDNLISGDRPRTSNRGVDIIAGIPGLDSLNSMVGNEFIISNPNGKTLNFQLFDNTFTQIPEVALNTNDTTAWLLTLLVTPIEEEPNNYDLRYGLKIK